MEAKLCLMKWELGWVFVANSTCLELLFPVPANLVSAGLSLSRCVSYRPQPGGEGAEKGFLGGLGLNEYRPLMDRVAGNLAMGAKILHITEEAWWEAWSGPTW